ncbi:MAG: DegT/DnrJ/EryC1/StrS family aminotransferase [Spirochaetes bacterium]|nr:DegT/DnrJ/EryC1/StrS family aminotransferase [Spirochaetota bacterium]
MSQFKLNFTDLKRQYKNIEKEIEKAVKEVLESSAFINGPQVSKLEEEVAKYCDSKFGIGVASGTDALLLPLMAIDIQPGDEVITTPFTFIATAEVIALLKAKPVFVDIDETTYNIDVKKIEEKITDRTKAIIPVHLFGQMSDMDEIMDLAKKHDLTVIEDACQAIGAEYKNKKACSIGDFSALSFFPSKNLGGYGDGGMVITNNEEYAKKIKMLRQHGSSIKYEHSELGINGRLDTLQAAILIVKLKHLNTWIDNRIRLAERYTKHLKDHVTTPVIRDDNKAVYNQYTIRTEKRDDLIKHLSENGIPTAIHYQKPLHLQECFKYLGLKENDLPISEKVSNDVFSLPMFPEMKEEEQDMVINTILDFFK